MMTAKYFDDLAASPLCRGDAEEVTTELRFEFDTVLIVIEDVPALRCAGRDDLLVPGPVGVFLGDLAFEVAERVQAKFAELESGVDEPVETRLKFPSSLRNLTPA